MTIDWQAVVTTLGGFGIIVTGSVWLLRKVIDQYLSKNLEAYKQRLAAESTRETDRFKHELTLVAQEHRVLLNKLHEKRADVIGKTYELLVKSQRSGAGVVSPFGREEEKHATFVDALQVFSDFFNYFDSHRIYLPAELCDQLETFFMDMRKSMISYGVLTGYVTNPTLRASTEDKRFEAWIRAGEHFDQNVPAARKLLEDALRDVITPPRPTSSTK